MIRHPVFCILPPYMLEHLARHGEQINKDRARLALAVTDQLRQQRAALSQQPRPAPQAAAGPNKQRVVYSADNGSTLPGRVVRTEGSVPTGDAAADEAFDGAGATFDLYWDIYQHNSIDNAGMRIDSTVHYQQGYDNAFWNGEQMVYGDGDEDLPADQRLFNRFTIAIDVISHELTHGVTQFSANLTYAGQPGALNESVSDVFGSLVKQRTLNQDALSADWIIGAGLFTANVNGVGIRSMEAPGTAYDDPALGKDPQPAHMSGYVNTIEDNGGVHINSGIPNRAFYLTAHQLGGFAWEKAGRIWYAALRGKFTAGTNFQGAADLTYAAAGELYGANSLEQQAVSQGWAGVGITVGASQPSGCLTSALRLLGFR